MTIDDLMLGRSWRPMTAQQHADSEAFLAMVTEQFTKSFLGTWVRSLGGDLMECHCVMHAMDAVGVPTGLRFLIDEMRPPGLYVRHFDKHQDRLAEFQSRLDRAKARRNERR